MEVTADPRGPGGSSPSLATTWEYEPRTNQPVRIVDPRGAVTEIRRDAVGLPQEVVRAAGAPEESVTALDHNPYGQLIQRTNPNGHLTRYEYADTGPSAGYLKRTIQDPGGLAITTRYETDPRGNVTAVIDPRGVRHESVYNELDWLVETTRAATGSADGAPPLSYVTRYLYDEVGNLVEERRPYGDDGSTFTRTRTTYGPLSEVLTVSREIEPGGPEAVTQHTYDPNLNLTQVIAPEGQTTASEYDPRNLPTATHRPEGVSESFGYDLEGMRTAFTDGRGQVWTTTYDGYGRAAETADPLGHRRRTSYL